MRFHVLGLDHIPAKRAYSFCAFTQKAIKLLRILLNYGHEVYFYCVEGSDGTIPLPVRPARPGGKLTLVELLSENERRETYGEQDWCKEVVRSQVAEGRENAARTAFNRRAAAYVNSIKREDDFVLCTVGHFRRQAVDEIGLHLTVEPGIGYSGSYARFRVFESYAWMHFTYGQEDRTDGNWWDAVIPNYYDPADFPFVAKPGLTPPLEKNGERYGDYFLFMGRLITRKGVAAAVQTAEAVGKKIVLVGQGSLKDLGFSVADGLVTVLDAVGPRDRAALMGNALACFVPTHYIEPFGGVNVEAQLCGTPVVTTDWGVFPETVIHGTTGYRCRSFEEFVWAAHAAQRLDRGAIRDIAAANYGLDRVGGMFEHYWHMIAKTLQDDSWYSGSELRNLDWLAVKSDSRR